MFLIYLDLRYLILVLHNFWLWLVYKYKPLSLSEVCLHEHSENILYSLLFTLRTIHIGKPTDCCECELKLETPNLEVKADPEVVNHAEPLVDTETHHSTLQT